MGEADDGMKFKDSSEPLFHTNINQKMIIRPLNMSNASYVLFAEGACWMQHEVHEVHAF